MLPFRRGLARQPRRGPRTPGRRSPAIACEYFHKIGRQRPHVACSWDRRTSPAFRRAVNSVLTPTMSRSHVSFTILTGPMRFPNRRGDAPPVTWRRLRLSVPIWQPLQRLGPWPCLPPPGWPGPHGWSISLTWTRRNWRARSACPIQSQRLTGPSFACGRSSRSRVTSLWSCCLSAGPPTRSGLPRCWWQSTAATTGRCRCSRSGAPRRQRSRRPGGKERAWSYAAGGAWSGSMRYSSRKTTQR